MNKFLSQAFSKNSLIHGLLLAVITSIITAVKPFVNTGTMPNQAQFIQIGWAAVIVGGSYFIKNGFFGSSNNIPPSTIQPIIPPAPQMTKPLHY